MSRVLPQVRGKCLRLFESLSPRLEGFPRVVSVATNWRYKFIAQPDSPSSTRAGYSPRPQGQCTPFGTLVAPLEATRIEERGAAQITQRLEGPEGATWTRFPLAVEAAAFPRHCARIDVPPSSLFHTLSERRADTSWCEEVKKKEQEREDG